MMKDATLLQLAEQRERWRAELLTAIRPITCLLSLAGLLVVTFLMKRTVRLFPMVGFSTVLLASVWPRVSTDTRALLMSISLPAMCILGIPSFGLAPNVFTGLLVSGAFSVLFLDRRRALMVNVLLGGGLLAMMAAIAFGAVTVSPWWSVELDPNRPGNVVRVLVLFLLASLTLALSLSHVLRRMERLVLEKGKALALLEIESAKKRRLQAEVWEFEKQAARVRELEQLGRLARYFGHDVNNALLVVSASMEILKNPDEEESQQAEALAALGDAAHQIREVASQLRAFGPGRGMQAGSSNLESVMKGIARMLRQILPKEIAVSVGEASPVSVAMSKPELQRILTNLSLNARDAMKDHGTLSIQTRVVTPSECAALGMPGMDMVLIEVRDTGDGIPEAIREKIFEPDFTTKGMKGTGLGLSSVLQGVEACGGFVRVDSELGKGTLFSVFLPVHKASAAPKERTSEFAVQIGSILVVDEALVRNSVLRALRARGLSAYGLSTIPEAIPWIANAPEAPFLVLLGDPDPVGIQDIHAALQARRSPGRIIVCGEKDLDTTQLPASVSFLAKPFTVPELMTAVERRIVEKDPPGARQHDCLG